MNVMYENKNNIKPLPKLINQSGLVREADSDWLDNRFCEKHYDFSSSNDHLTFNDRNYKKHELVRWMSGKILKKIFESNCTAFFVTLTYKENKKLQISCSDAEQRLKAFYKSVFLPLLVCPKYYDSKRNKSLHPAFYAFTDKAGSKVGKPDYAASHHSSINSIHHHGVLVVHPASLTQARRLVGRNTLCLSPFSNEKFPTIIKTSDFQEIPLPEIETVLDYACSTALDLQLREDAWFTILGPSDNETDTGFLPNSPNRKFRKKQLQTVRTTS